MFFPPILKGRACIADSADSLTVKECSFPDSIFDFFFCKCSEQRVKGLFFLFFNVTMHGDVSHLLSCLYSFFPLIAMTN